MSQENVEVVRRLFTTLDSQDWEAALGLFDPEVEWSPTEGNFHGLEGVVTSLAEWLEPWEEHHIEAEEFTGGTRSWRSSTSLVAPRGAGCRSTSASFRSMPCATERSLEWSSSSDALKPLK